MGTSLFGPAGLPALPAQAQKDPEAPQIHCDRCVVSGHSSDRFTRLGGTGGSEIVSHDHFRDPPSRPDLLLAGECVPRSAAAGDRPTSGWRPAPDTGTAPSQSTGTPLWAEPEDTPCDGRCRVAPSQEAAAAGSGLQDSLAKARHVLGTMMSVTFASATHSLATPTS